jgi:hypothetical protein
MAAEYLPLRAVWSKLINSGNGIMEVTKLCVDSGSAFNQYATSSKDLYQQYRSLSCDDGSLITVERGHISQVLTSKESSGDRIIFVGLAGCVAIVEKFANGIWRFSHGTVACQFYSDDAKMPYQKGVEEIRNLMTISPQAAVKTWIFDDGYSWQDNSVSFKKYGFKTDNIIWIDYTSKGNGSFDIDIVMEAIPTYTIYRRNVVDGILSRVRLENGILN